MFLEVRSSLESGLGLKPPASSYWSYFYSSFKTSPSIQHHTKANKFQGKTYQANSPATKEHSPELQDTGCPVTPKP